MDELWQLFCSENKIDLPRFDIHKDNPGIALIKNWIDEQYANGRTTTISDEELLSLIRKNLPELL